jgi:hypothetical protein
VYLKLLLTAIAVIGVLASTVRAEQREGEHGRLFDNDRRHEQFGGGHEGRGHIPVVPEANPAPVLGAMLLASGIAYEIKRRRKNKLAKVN